MNEPAAENRTRLIFALALVGLFAILVVAIVVLQSGGEEERDFAAAPEECIDGWNSNEGTAGLGQHQAVAHNYSRVEVAYATGDGSKISPKPFEDSSCVLVFAASQLDSELAAAAIIQRRSSWEPMIVNGADATVLNELQDGALEAANATLGADGRLSPL